MDIRNLIFSWDPVNFTCPSLQYNFSTSNCGICVPINISRAVACTGFNLSPTRNNCMFSVSSIACGSIRGQNRTATVRLRGIVSHCMINSKSVCYILNHFIEVPSSPSVQCVPRYSNSRLDLKFLTKLSTTFNVETNVSARIAYL